MCCPMTLGHAQYQSAKTIKQFIALLVVHRIYSLITTIYYFLFVAVTVVACVTLSPGPPLLDPPRPPPKLYRNSI